VCPREPVKRDADVRVLVEVSQHAPRPRAAFRRGTVVALGGHDARLERSLTGVGLLRRRPRDEPSWGRPALPSSAAAIAAAIWGSTSEEYGAGYGLAITLFVAGGPVVHALNHHPARALASAGLRVGVPVLCMILGGGIGAASAGRQPPDNYASFPVWFGGAAAGLSLGILGAIIADDAFLAFDEEPAPPVGSRALAPRRSFSVAPLFSVARDREHGDRTTVGVGGTF